MNKEVLLDRDKGEADEAHAAPASEEREQPRDPEFDDPDAGSAKSTSGGWSPGVSRSKIAAGLLVILAGIVAAFLAWGINPFDRGEETTNNAYVRGQTTVISPQVAGYLIEVPVRDFDRVQAGQLLARIDPAPFRQRLRQGEANIAAQRATLANSQQSLRSGEAQARLQDAAVASARAGLEKAQADMRRIAELAGEGSVSLRERDQARAALKQAQAAVQQAQAQRAIAGEQVRTVEVGRGALEAQVEGAGVAAELARIDLSRTEIRAPRAGRLSEVSARVGQLVSAGTQLMYLVPDDLWITANFKETQTARMAVGQRASLTVDALGGAKLSGRVQSIAPAAGTEFSLIKPDAGAGNFVKVPQRIAVRIVLDRDQPLAARLGPGMSVVATVHTGNGN
ncbi:HlyD family secretion protein [Sphingomonas swuensis]|uniref:HlyD family secretion protein n=1 Tax=Sphingomonas swuensis TaxID=977800 RepID=A0ABP7SMZ3_9SPHN